MKLLETNGAQLKEPSTGETGCLSFEPKTNHKQVFRLPLEVESATSQESTTNGNGPWRKRSIVKKTQRNHHNSPSTSIREGLLQSVVNTTLDGEFPPVPDEDTIREPDAEDLKRVEQEFCLEKLFTSKGRSKEKLKQYAGVSNTMNKANDILVDRDKQKGVESGVVSQGKL